MTSERGNRGAGFTERMTKELDTVAGWNRARSPQSEDHKAGIEAAWLVAEDLSRSHVEAIVDAYLSRAYPSPERDTEGRTGQPPDNA